MEMEEIRRHLPQGLMLEEDSDGLFLAADGQILRADFTRMLPRLKQSNLNSELLVRAARIKGADGPLTALDATAGLGEDSLLLAAAGFSVTMYEWNPVVFALLQDGLRRAQQSPELTAITSRMQVIHADSTDAMRTLTVPPDVILLDPMFPERQKSALVKKKLQMIQKLEMPCTREGEILRAALEAGARKVIVKRPPKGPFLAEVKPDYSLSGKAVRFDCMAAPFDKKLREWEKENA